MPPQRSKTVPVDNSLSTPTSPKTESVKPEDVESRDLHVNVFVRLKDILSTPIQKVLARRYVEEIKKNPVNFLPEKTKESFDQINQKLEIWQQSIPDTFKTYHDNLNMVDKAKEIIEESKRTKKQNFGETTSKDLDKKIRVLELAQKRVGPFAWLRQSSAAQKEALEIVKKEYQIKPNAIAQSLAQAKHDLEILRGLETTQKLANQSIEHIRDKFLDDFDYLKDYKKIELEEKRRADRAKMEELQEAADKLWHDEMGR